ncbi:MAG TPA: hypothetical protein VD865_09005 [Stenotrophomonas sp.]|nr:hypothetical protein [Stenotrophomonas sp.]
MKRTLLLLAGLFASTAALAQSEDSATDARSLDLSVPQAPMQYMGDPAYAKDPPGTFYGDKTGTTARAPDGRVADVVDDKLQVHGAVAMGVGYSNRGGNSNWQAATINLSKNYTTDEGKTNTFGLNISVGQGEGPGYYNPGYYGHRYYGPYRSSGPGPMGW